MGIKHIKDAFIKIRAVMAGSLHEITKNRVTIVQFGFSSVFFWILVNVIYMLKFEFLVRKNVIVLFVIKE